MRNIKFPVIIEKDADGYFAICPDLQGCYTQGETYEQALSNIKEVIDLIIEDMTENGEEISAPDEVSFTSVELAVK